MAYIPSLCFAPAGIDGCALWRMYMPHLNLPHSRFLFTEGIPQLDEMSECDIVVVQRLMLEGNMTFLKTARAHGLRIVYDLDDNFWEMPDANPAKKIFQQESVMQGVENCVEWADAITVSTKQLADVVKKRCAHLRNAASKKPIPVVHIDNCADLNYFHPPIIERDPDKITIGWGGSNTHAGDVGVVWSLLPELLMRFPNLHLEFIGQAPPSEIARHHRVRVRPWCHISEYANRYATWNWDIVLAPLEEHPFNESKSCIKMIEAGSIQSICLAQDIAPYSYFAGKNRDLKWLLCTFKFDWQEKLVRLIKDKALRQDLSEKMYENVYNNFNITRTVEQWKQLSYALV
jgi:glycosyltransferase involved in cell wall biosynthesis